MNLSNPSAEVHAFSPSTTIKNGLMFAAVVLFTSFHPAVGLTQQRTTTENENHVEVTNSESPINPETKYDANHLKGKLLATFAAPEATQAVAVDEQHFYAIANSVIAKYRKVDGRKVLEWKASPDVDLKHLNSGVVLEGKLYCCNSNFPKFPETSSIEIFDPETLQHIGTHSFGIYEGSLTWIDWHDDAWWAVFAHYSKKVNEDPNAKPHSYTSLIKFDSKWRRLEGWVFPAEVLDRFSPHSCSGGGWGADGELYVTGHDLGELYVLRLPQAGSTLRLVRTIEVPITGQGIAWDQHVHRKSMKTGGQIEIEKDADGLILYGISRRDRSVKVCQIPDATSWNQTPQSSPAPQHPSMIKSKPQNGDY